MGQGAVVVAGEGSWRPAGERGAAGRSSRAMRMMEHPHLLCADCLPSLPVLHLHIRHLLFWTSPFITLTGSPPSIFLFPLLSRLVLDSTGSSQHPAGPCSS